MAHIRTKGEGPTRRYEVVWQEGSRRRSKTHLREKDAKTHWLELERRARLGSLYEAPPETFGAFADGWLERYTPGLAPSTVIKAKAARANLALLDELMLPSVTGAVLEDCITAVARRAPRQGQLALGYAKQILKDAQARGQHVHATALRVRPPRYAKRQARFLTLPELDHLCSWCEEPHLVRFAALSGLRQGECFALRESAISFEDAYVIVERGAYLGQPTRTKKNKVRRVHVPHSLLTTLREQLLARSRNADRGPEALVFPAPRGSMWLPSNFNNRVLRPAAERAKLAGTTFHDLRHTAASLLIASGANPLQVAAQLGHTDGNGRPDPTLIWRVYGHLFPGSGEAAAAALEQMLRSQSGPTADRDVSLGDTKSSHP